MTEKVSGVMRGKSANGGAVNYLGKGEQGRFIPPISEKR
jgi:hypothetical protein